jgi:23S rRNA pseudouridine1911/1915/1917 synthase
MKLKNMSERHKIFKSPPKRYQPKGLTIIYEDHDILVVDKVSGLLTMGNAKVRENTAYFSLNEYVRKGTNKSKNRILIVHRLDKDTSGVIIFAKNEKAKRYLQDEWKGFSKKYYAVVNGILPKKEEIITSYLTENKAHKMYSVNDPKKGKISKTGYKVLKESKKFSLLEIDLFTGRKNQIRVHLSERGFPVTGDNKYGKKEKGIRRLMLHSSSITILHPSTKEEMTFETKTPDCFISLVNG